jgi:hypothetical protein
MSIRPSPPAPTQPSRQKEGGSSSSTEDGADMLASILGFIFCVCAGCDRATTIVLDMVAHSSRPQLSYIAQFDDDRPWFSKAHTLVLIIDFYIEYQNPNSRRTSTERKKFAHELQNF